MVNEFSICKLGITPRRGYPLKLKNVAVTRVLLNRIVVVQACDATKEK